MTLGARERAFVVVTGATRSGKSRFAETIARGRGGDVTYLATAPAVDGDAEWAARIADHRANRDPSWRTIETAIDDVDLARFVADASARDVLVVESLGTWLAAEVSAFVSVHGDAADTIALETRLRERARALRDACVSSAADVIVVCEQTGWGLVPSDGAARAFSSVLGRATTALARAATQAHLVVAGYALELRIAGRRLDVEDNL